MTYKLFIDDERFPATEDWVIARTSEEAKNVVRQLGMPSFISFDHDLGGADTTMIFIHWLVEITLNAMEAGDHVTFPAYDVHSQNPVGERNIRSLMDSFTNFLKDDR
jgi:hypothetical protein